MYGFRAIYEHRPAHLAGSCFPAQLCQSLSSRAYPIGAGGAGRRISGGRNRLELPPQQSQRAFEYTYRDIIGSSLPAARLRASIWQSIFTHDIRRYRRTLYARMGEFATLITGPSGTGKELAARAIAESRYVPFDDRRLAFASDDTASFFPINISALSPTLVESELFGHRRGAFTGAVADRQGWR